MTTFFSSPFTIPICAILCFGIVWVVQAICESWRLTRQAELEAGLKNELIQQGRSADEIERILKITMVGKTKEND